MTTDPNNNNGQSSTNLQNKKITTARWIAGGIFIIFALVNGFHYSSLLLLIAAFLIFPLSFVNTFLQRKNIKPTLAIILSILLFFIATIVAPPTKTNNSSSNNTNQSSLYSQRESQNPLKNDESASNSNSYKPNNSSPEKETFIMVWVTSSGSKYHSKSTCSNMTSPAKISLENAKKQGYTACKKCY